MLGCLGPSTFYCPKPVLHVGACEVSPWVLSVKCAAWRVQSVAGYFLRGVFLGVCSLLWVHAALLVPRAPLCPSCRRAAEPCWAGAKAPAALPCCSAVKCAALVRRCLEEKELVLTPKLSLAFLAEQCWIEAGLESGSGTVRVAPVCCPAACKAVSTVLCFHCPSGVLCLQGLLAGPPRLGRAEAFPTVRDWPRMCWVGAALASGLLWARPGAGLLPDGCFGMLCLSRHPCVRASASVNYNCLAFKLPYG